MSFGQIPSSWIPGSYSKSIFNIFTCIHTIFHSDWTNSKSLQQGISIPLSNICYSAYSIISILTWLNCYLIVILILIFLMASDEYFSIYFLVFSISSFENCLSRSFDLFKTELVIFMLYRSHKDELTKLANWTTQRPFCVTTFDHFYVHNIKLNPMLKVLKVELDFILILFSMKWYTRG